MTVSGSFFAMLLQVEPTPSLLEYITAAKVFGALVTLGTTWLLVRFTSRLLNYLSLRVAKARFFFKRIEPIVRITLWFVAVFIIIDLLAPSQGTFFAAIGSVALALGLGAQDLIKNVIGGLVVLTDRPFQIGDRVKIGNAYGEIDHIGLRSTKMTTPDDNRVTIPNAEILTTQIFNSNSGVPDCQVVTDVYVDPEVDPDLLLRVGKEAACSSRYLLLSKPVVVLLTDVLQQRHSLRLRIKAYVYDHRFEAAMQSDITTAVKRELRRIKIARDQTDLVTADGKR